MRDASALNVNDVVVSKVNDGQTNSGTVRTYVVSADGQTMTMSAAGSDFNAVVAFDRVQ